MFPGLLPLMENLIIKGRLRAVRHVRDEIKDSDDELTLAKWCKAQNDFYLDDSGAIQIKVREIMNEFQNPKKTRGISNADQFVISQAVINGDKWCVVSSERPANGDAHKKTRTFPLYVTKIESGTSGFSICFVWKNGS